MRPVSLPEVLAALILVEKGWLYKALNEIGIQAWGIETVHGDAHPRKRRKFRYISTYE